MPATDRPERSLDTGLSGYRPFRLGIRAQDQPITNYLHGNERGDLIVSRSLIKVSAFASVCCLTFAACAQNKQTTAPGPGATSGEAQKVQAACREDLAIEKGFNKTFSDLPPSEGPPTPEIAAKIREGLTANVIPHVDKISQNPPNEIKEEIRTASDGVRKFRDDPSQDPTRDKNFRDAVDKIDAYFYNNCSGPKQSVEAREYKFDGVPATVKAGDLRVRLQDKGREAHELVVLGKKPGVTESFEQILRLPEEQAMQKTEYIGGVDPISPGESGYGVVSLTKPGDYLAVCFIPQGTTTAPGDEVQAGGPPASPGGASEAASTGGSTGASPAGSTGPSASPSGAGGDHQGGQPHAMLGMRKEFKVT